MGVLHYGSYVHPFELDDRLVAHLRFVVLEYLRRGDGLALTVMQASPYPPRQTTIWIHPGIAIRFELDDTEPPALDRDLTKALAAAASTLDGIMIKDGQLVASAGAPGAE
ncbi:MULTISPECIES: DUF7882 family protein [unclassified Microbacterium]|uniref:DUF7882 family protein n=1 Tax=unclassified Microbacterium TaxID=2609290 RepID=UPI0030102FB1